MTYLGKNINLVLVGLILVTVVLAVGTAMLYQRGLEQRTDEYETTNTNLSQCLTMADNYKDKLVQRETELNQTSQDIRKYDLLYEQKVSDLEVKQQEVVSTKQQLSSMTLQKEQYKNLYGDALINISSLQVKIGNLERDNNALRGRVSDLLDDLNQCESGG